MTIADAELDSAALDAMFDHGRDRGGNFAPPAEPEPAKRTEPEATPQPEPQKQESPAAQDQKGDDGERRLVPLAELKAERQKRQDFERQLADVTSKMSTYEQLMARLTAQPQMQPHQQYQQPAAPDPYTDPVGAMNHRVAELQRDFETKLLNANQAAAEDRFGKDVVAEATQAALRAGKTEEFRYNRDPFGDLVKWHRQQKVLSEIGSDPDAWKKQMRDTFRNELLAELKKGGTGQQQQRFPGSLSDATSAGSVGSVQPTEEQMLSAMFDPNRSRRAF